MVTFFGAVDRNRDGKICSQTPAWALETNIENMKESIESDMRRYERGDVPQDSIPLVKARIDKESTRLKTIMDSKPVVTDIEKDIIAKAYEELKGGIKESLFTRTEMMKKGLVSPQDEYERMKKPCIKVDGKTAEICEKNGIEVKNGMVSRDNATRVFSWCGSFLGENTNVERLRMDERVKSGRPVSRR